MSAAPDFSLFAGENLAVNADAISIGDSSVSQTVELKVDGTTVDSTDVTLAAAGATTPQQDLSLVWATDSGDVGSHTVTVASNDDSVSRSVDVLTPADFAVSITGTSSPVAPGGTLDVTADITNNGDTTAVDNAILDITTNSGLSFLGVDQQSVAVGSGGTVSTTLQWAVPPDKTEESATATVEIGDASASTSITIAGFPETQSDNYWDFDDGSGSVAADSNGSFNADFGTAISWSSTSTGETYGVLDGSSGADLGGASQSHWSHWANSGEGAVGLWINPDQVSDRMGLFGSSGSSTERTIDLRVDSGNVSFAVGTNSGEADVIDIRNGGTIVTNEWTSVAVRADGSDAELLINGTVVETDTVSTTQSGDLQKFNQYIGEDPQVSGREWDGGLDDLWSTQTDPGQQTIKDWHDKTKDNH